MGYNRVCPSVDGKRCGKSIARLNLSAAGKFTPILPANQAIISVVGKKKKKCLECQCEKQESLLPSQLFPFPSIVLTVLENDATKGKA